MFNLARLYRRFAGAKSSSSEAESEAEITYRKGYCLRSGRHQLAIFDNLVDAVTFAKTHLPSGTRLKYAGVVTKVDLECPSITRAIEEGVLRLDCRHIESPICSVCKKVMLLDRFPVMSGDKSLPAVCKTCRTAIATASEIDKYLTRAIPSKIELNQNRIETDLNF